MSAVLSSTPLSCDAFGLVCIFQEQDPLAFVQTKSLWAVSSPLNSLSKLEFVKLITLFDMKGLITPDVKAVFDGGKDNHHRHTRNRGKRRLQGSVRQVKLGVKEIQYVLLDPTNHLRKFQKDSLMSSSRVMATTEGHFCLVEILPLLTHIASRYPTWDKLDPNFDFRRS